MCCYIGKACAESCNSLLFLPSARPVGKRHRASVLMFQLPNLFPKLTAARIHPELTSGALKKIYEVATPASRQSLEEYLLQRGTKGLGFQRPHKTKVKDVQSS